VATALAATIYASVTSNQTADGHSQGQALASGLGATSWVMAAISALGVLMAVMMGRHRTAQGTLEDIAASAASGSHTLPTSASGSGGAAPNTAGA
jgi:hypothetical protein